MMIEAASMTFAITSKCWTVISGCMTVESCLLAAVGRTHEQGLLSIIAAVVNLAFSILLVQRIGAVGVIAGTILSYVLVLIVPQSLIVRSVFRGTVASWRTTAADCHACGR